MRKSNIVLIFVFALAFGLLGFTVSSLKNKFRTNDLRVETWRERSTPMYASNAVFVTPTFRHIRFTESIGFVYQVTIVDSLIVDSNGNPLTHVDYRQKNGKPIDPTKQFVISKDTMFVNLDNIEEVTIYSTGLRSVSSIKAAHTRSITMSSIKADSMTVYADWWGKIVMENCYFKHLQATASVLGSVICESSTRVDTLDFSVGSSGTLELDNFKGEIRDVFIHNEGTLNLEGCSITAFKNVKWN